MMSDVEPNKSSKERRYSTVHVQFGPEFGRALWLWRYIKHTWYNMTFNESIWTYLLSRFWRGFFIGFTQKATKSHRPIADIHWFVVPATRSALWRRRSNRASQPLKSGAIFGVSSKYIWNHGWQGSEGCTKILEHLLSNQLPSHKNTGYSCMHETCPSISMGQANWDVWQMSFV